MPLLISMMAMAAKNRLVTLEIVLVPVRPSSLVIGLANQKMIPAKAMLLMAAAAVIILPWVLASRMHVARTAGPVINGTPMGTEPRLSTSTPRGLFSALSRLLREIASRRKPPGNHEVRNGDAPE